MQTVFVEMFNRISSYRLLGQLLGLVGVEGFIRHIIISSWAFHQPHLATTPDYAYSQAKLIGNGIVFRIIE